MKSKFATSVILLAILAGLACGQAAFRLPALEGSEDPAGLVEVLFAGNVEFIVTDARAGILQLQVRDERGTLLFDSGLVQGDRVAWQPPDWEWENRRYDLFAWDGQGQAVGAQTGRLLNQNGQVLAAALAYDVAGNFTIGGYLVIGTGTPERAVHIKGSNAVFRMDRSSNTAAFMLVRTDAGGAILKNYVLAVDACGANNGQFVINGPGQATGGGENRRITIDNALNVTFAVGVRAKSFISNRSIKF